MPANPEIQAVAFDLDGLMFNTEDLYDEVIDQVLVRRGSRFSDELKLKMMGLPGLEAIGVMCRECDLQEPHQQLLDEIHAGMIRTLPGRLEQMPGLQQLLDRLHRLDLPCSIATSSPRSFAVTCLQISNLEDRFRFLLTAEDVRRGKPHPDIYLESAARHGVAPGCLLVLEDSWNGSRAAAAAGAYTVAVPGRHSRDQDFSHADQIIESLTSPRLTVIIDGGTP